MKVQLTLNGEPISTEVEPFVLLLEFIRARGLTATKEGCGVGVCGACSVLVNGLPISACLTFLGCCEGAEIWTAEGIAHTQPALVDAFVEHEALGCGACTPGQLVAAAALAAQTDTTDVRRYLAGNLCRCTGYAPIVAAVESIVRRG